MDARLKDVDRLATLIARGTDVNAPDRTGAATLMTAAAVDGDDQSAAMMKLLIAAGGDLNAADNQGRTAARAAGIHIRATCTYSARVIR